MPNIYAGPLLELSERVLARLPGVARTAGPALVVIGNGHAAWQMAIDNTMVPGDRVLVLESGIFATIWGRNAAAAGVEVEVLPGNMSNPIDPEAVRERLAADDGSIVAVLMAQTDTASSVRNDIPAIRAAIDAAGHGALLMVDGIASIGTEAFEMDEWGIDLAIGASQKGLMCPPGVAFVWAGARAIARYKSLSPSRPRNAYVDWADRLEPDAIYQSYSGTPPVSHLRALDVALDLIDEEGGLQAVWERHRVLAGAVHAAVEAWSSPDGLQFNIASAAHRSNAVTTIRTGSVDSDALGRICEERFGVTLGIGIADARGRSFRIGHMGHLNPPMVFGALSAVESALIALGAPMGGSGLAAAADYLGKATAEAIR